MFFSISGKTVIVTTKNKRTSRAIDILSFWHRLEFFTPYNLSKRVEPLEKKKVFWLRANDLEEQLEAIRTWHPKDGYQISSMNLFAGVFPLAELEQFAQEILPNKNCNFLDDERGLPEGYSCFARFSMSHTPDLHINFLDLELSTLPWALGQSRKYGLDFLSSQAWKESLPRLQDRLLQISEHDQKEPNGQHVIKQITGALEALQNWAAFRLMAGEVPLACIEVNIAESRNKSSQTQTEKENDEDTEFTSEVEIGILNSFYISDIEFAMAEIVAGGNIGTLSTFLNGLLADSPIDLYGPEGHAALIKGLTPTANNRGRWMSPPSHAMSLMQQFAINQAIALRDAEGLFSVNGPPGTGKTTLLRDIIADNLVARAEILSHFKTVKQTFEDKKIQVSNNEGGISYLSVLKPELRGFGMVIASSNNAAVENISLDLPKSASVVVPEEFGYLQRIAHKVAAQKSDGTLAKLTPEDTPWGLIAASLGRSANRYQFAQKVFFSPVKRKNEKASSHQPAFSIWDWRNNYDGPSFAKAAETFRAQSIIVHRLTKEVDRFAQLNVTLHGKTEGVYTKAAKDELDAATQHLDTARTNYVEAEKAIYLLREQLEAQREQERLITLQRPSWYIFLLGLPASRNYKQHISANAAEQLALNTQIQEARQNLQALEIERQAAESVVAQASLTLNSSHAIWKNLTDELQKLQGQGYSLPEGALDDLEQENVQISGLWHHDNLSEARSALTRSALQLHEAWLAEVSRTGMGFGSNLVLIRDFLTGKYKGDPAHIWESLFMVVPVISTTFASFARQFNGMGPNSLGWLFIDEAGQAVPQAAVGALLRARRAIVIGDPLQIEPVFTLPSSLIEAMAKLSKTTADGMWSPHTTSVQALADQTNRYGAKINTQGDESIWIGSPLRVHRRCADPMFTLANNIAYQGKMVFGAAKRIPVNDVAPFLGESAWIDLPGKVVAKQMVREQIDFMIELISVTVNHEKRLPKLYVISPFKEIATELKQQLRKIDWTQRGLSKRAIDKWLRQNIGTVHTFQGKEQEAVFMLLGADAKHQGAARWAALKPNLLNVALTRAKTRFYAVGDRQLWAEMSGFDSVVHSLPRLQPAEALSRAKETSGCMRMAHPFATP